MQNQQTNAPAQLAGWQKWLLVVAIIGGLSAIVIYFNLTVFRANGGWLYACLVGVVCLVSFVVTLHLQRSAFNGSFLKAAFVVEVAAMIALGVNAGYSLSVLRQMGVAGDAEKAQLESAQARGETIAAIAKLKGGKTQQNALRGVNATPPPPAFKTRQQIFTEYEGALAWIMAGEVAVAAAGFLLLLALSVFDRNRNGKLDFLAVEGETEPGEESKRIAGFIRRSPAPHIRPAFAHRIGIKRRGDDGENDGPKASRR